MPLYFCFLFCETINLAVSLRRNLSTMFEFDQYLGFLAFMTILTIGFWLMIFLLTFAIPYWVFGSAIEALKEKRAAKKLEDKS